MGLQRYNKKEAKRKKDVHVKLHDTPGIRVKKVPIAHGIKKAGGNK